MIRSTLNYTRQNAIAFLALFVALSGTAFAATSLPKNSVGNKQLKKSSVTGVKVKKNTLTGLRLKNDTLTGTQILESSLGRVPDADKIDGIDSKVFGTALTVAGSVFEPRDSAGTTKKNYIGTGAISADTTAGDFHYAIHLPQGARVTGLDFRYIDNDGVANPSLSLYAFNSIGENGTESESLVTVGSAASISSLRRNASAAPAEPLIIDNTKWSYVLVWTPVVASPTSVLVGARVNYTLPTN